MTPALLALLKNTYGKDWPSRVAAKHGIPLGFIEEWGMDGCEAPEAVRNGALDEARQIVTTLQAHIGAVESGR